MKNWQKLLWSVIFASFVFNTQLFYVLASSSLQITEIAYDTLDSDTDHEWVEIFNSSTLPLDIIGWKISEDGKANHTLNIPPKNGGLGNMILDVGEYAIIADNANIFLQDYPQFSGTLIDSSFSLNNTTGIIQIFGNTGNDINLVSYDKNLGASGDGNTLQLNQAGTWVANLPTIGTSTLEIIISDDNSTSTNSTSTDETSSTSTEDTFASSTDAVEEQNITTTTTIIQTVYVPVTLYIERASCPATPVIKSEEKKDIVKFEDTSVIVSGLIKNADGLILELRNITNKDYDLYGHKIFCGESDFEISKNTIASANKKFTYILGAEISGACSSGRIVVKDSRGDELFVYENMFSPTPEISAPKALIKKFEQVKIEPKIVKVTTLPKIDIMPSKPLVLVSPAKLEASVVLAEQSFLGTMKSVDWRRLLNFFR